MQCGVDSKETGLIWKQTICETCLHSSCMHLDTVYSGQLDIGIAATNNFNTNTKLFIDVYYTVANVGFSFLLTERPVRVHVRGLRLWLYRIKNKLNIQKFKHSNKCQD